MSAPGNARSEAPAAGPSARTGLVYLMDQGAVSAGNFLTGLLLGRVCEKGEFGAYTIAFTLLGALNTLQSSLVTGPMAVFGASREGGALRRYFGGSLLLQLLLSFGLSGAVVAGALAWRAADSTALYPTAFLCMGIALFFEQLQEFARRALLSRFRGVGAFLNDSVGTVLRLGILGGIVLWRSGAGGAALSAGEAYLAVAAAGAIAGVIGLIQIRADLAFSRPALREAAGENLAFGRWILAQSLVAAAGGPLYSSFLALHHGPEAAGALGAAQTLVFFTNPLVFGLANFFGSAGAAAFASRGIEGLRQSTRRYATVSLLSTGTLLVAIALGGGVMLRVAYGGRYDQLHGLVAALCASMFIHILGRPLQAAMNALRRPDLLFRTQILSFLTIAALAWPLTVALGTFGVAVGNAIGSAILLASRGWAYRTAMRSAP